MDREERQEREELMATAVAIQFPLGRYHANPWGRNVNEGAVDWPPEPWRVMRALLATFHNRCPELREHDVLGVLAKLIEPPTYGVPVYRLAHSRHYLPDTRHRGGMAGATDKVLDSFAVCDPSDELVIVWNQDLDHDERAILAMLCERLPYLGRAESICDARLLAGVPDLDDARRAAVLDGDEPAGHEPVDLLAPTAPLDPEALGRRTVEVRSLGAIEPPASRRVRYARPGPAPLAFGRSRVGPSARRHPMANAIRYHIVANALPSQHAAVALTDCLRQAALSQYGRRHDGRPSRVLSGKEADGAKRTDDHAHAHYLAFAADPARSGTTLLDTLVVWAPGGLDQGSVDALLAVPELKSKRHKDEVRQCRLGVEAVGDVRHVAPELCGPAVRWRTATPMALARHKPRSQDVDTFIRDEAMRNLRYVGLGDHDVYRIEVVRDDALSFRRHRLSESLRQARHAFHVEITFGDVVAGRPIVLGALNHFGLGLFRPVD